MLVASPAGKPSSDDFAEPAMSLVREEPGPTLVEEDAKDDFSRGVVGVRGGVTSVLS